MEFSFTPAMCICLKGSKAFSTSLFCYSIFWDDMCLRHFVKQLSCYLFFNILHVHPPKWWWNSRVNYALMDVHNHFQRFRIRTEGEDVGASLWILQLHSPAKCICLKVSKTFSTNLIWMYPAIMVFHEMTFFWGFISNSSHLCIASMHCTHFFHIRADKEDLCRACGGWFYACQIIV